MAVIVCSALVFLYWQISLTNGVGYVPSTNFNLLNTISPLEQRNSNWKNVGTLKAYLERARGFGQLSNPLSPVAESVYKANIVAKSILESKKNHFQSSVPISQPERGSDVNDKAAKMGLFDINVYGESLLGANNVNQWLYSNGLGYSSYDKVVEPIGHEARMGGMGYGKPTQTYVPVVVKKKKKKSKLCSIDKGLFISGGTQAFGKFKSLKQCIKACSNSPTCFAGDYNPWLGACYFHGNTTACGDMEAHSKLTHFKKIPCDNFGAENFELTIGAQLFYGLLQKGIDNIKDCIKKCLNAGEGVAASPSALDEQNQGGQVCFGIDFDFSTHKCYFHVMLFRRDPSVADNAVYALCQKDDDNILTPIDLVANPSVINIIICPPE